MAFHKINVTVNGGLEQVVVPSNMTLMRMLREKAGPDRNEKWLLGRGMWRLHSSDERRAGQQLHGPGGRM